MNLLYFSNVWPQRHITAASHRVFGIISALIKNGFKVSFVCSSKKSKESPEIKEISQLQTYSVDPIDATATTQLLNNITDKPNIAIFDTFTVEEKFRLNFLIENLKFLYVLKPLYTSSLS